MPRKCQAKTFSRPLDLSDQSFPIRMLEQLYVYVRENDRETLALALQDPSLSIVLSRKVDCDVG